MSILKIQPLYFLSLLILFAVNFLFNRIVSKEQAYAIDWTLGLPSPSLDSVTLPREPGRYSREYYSLEEQNGRHGRFPSVEERIKLYMGSWYTPPCPGNLEATVLYQNTTDNKGNKVYLARELARKDTPKGPRTFVLPTNVQLVRTVALNKHSFKECSNAYCTDPIEHLLRPTMRLALEDIPMVFHFGDYEVTRGYITKKMGQVDTKVNLPIFKKFRTAYSREAISEITKESCTDGLPAVPNNVVGTNAGRENIIMKLKAKRHFGAIASIAPYDIPWDEKQDKAVFRGSLTGVTKAAVREKIQLKRCLKIKRCKMVLQTTNSTLVNAHLIRGENDHILPDAIGGSPIYGDRMSPQQMMQHKAIVMLEGNDVSSGLKWALYSNSVVMTQAATKTSWAMEELLEPWVHYVPLNNELSDVEEKMQWILDHDKEAQEIARRGSLWLKDLVFHPDSQLDDELIYEAMVKRSAAHFMYSEGLSVQANAKPQFKGEDSDHINGKNGAK